MRHLPILSFPDILSRLGRDKAVQRQDPMALALAVFECREMPVDLLFRIATVASRLPDFPDRVTFREHQGYRHGLAAVRTGGVWRLDGGPAVPYEGDVASAGRSDHFTLAVAGAYREANGRNPAEAAFAPWSRQDLAGQLAAVAPSLPPHVVLASLCRGRAIAATLGLAPDGRLFGDWADAVSALGHDPGAAPAEGAPPALFALANAARADEIQDLVSRGAAVGVSHEGDTALTRAISRGHVDVVQVLMDNGAVPAPDRDGYSPLRRALDSFDTLFLGDRAVDMARFLLAVGEDPHLPDSDGRTPAEEAAGLLDGTHPDVDAAAAEVVAMFEAARRATPALA
jgi:FOG: Ankyrin repeat